MNVVFLGRPGSGKGTQAKILAKELEVPHISTGDIFRDIIKKNTSYGKKLNNYIKNGILVPNDLTNEIIKQTLKKKEFGKGFILDGYPRTINQAKFLSSITDINYVINLTVTKKEIRKRILEREEKTGVKREDDKKEVIEKRLKEYSTKTKPLIEYYTKKKKLLNIDGNDSIEKINNRIQRKIKNEMFREIDENS